MRWTDRIRAGYPRPASWLGFLAAATLVFHLMLALGLPTGLKLAAFFLSLLLFLHVGMANALLVAVSLALGAGVVEAGLRIVGLDKAMYYRPHEMLARNHAPWGGHYRPNSAVKMVQPFSNLQAIANVGIFEPREIEWVTDSLGFRNRRDYHGQKRVLIGDSFVAGEANTQECTLNEFLLARHNIDVYNVSHPGDDLPHYIQKMRAFRERVPGDYKFVLFLFEDNDFGRGPYADIVPTRQTALREYQAWFRATALYRVTAWLAARASARGTAPATIRASLGGSEVVFGRNMADVVSDTRPFDESVMQWTPALRTVAPWIERIYFVPGKYRVQRPHFDGQGLELLPHRQWEYAQRVAAALGIPITDLTPTLVAEEGRLKGSGRHTFWRADTHWNCEGTAAAATVVARELADAR